QHPDLLANPQVPLRTTGRAETITLPPRHRVQHHLEHRLQLAQSLEGTEKSARHRRDQAITQVRELRESSQIDPDDQAALRPETLRRLRDRRGLALTTQPAHQESRRRPHRTVDLAHLLRAVREILTRHRAPDSERTRHHTT